MSFGATKEGRSGLDLLERARACRSSVPLKLAATRRFHIELGAGLLQAMKLALGVCLGNFHSPLLFWPRRVCHASHQTHDDLTKHPLTLYIPIRQHTQAIGIGRFG